MQSSRRRILFNTESCDNRDKRCKQKKLNKKHFIFEERINGAIIYRLDTNSYIHREAQNRTEFRIIKRSQQGVFENCVPITYHILIMSVFSVCRVFTPGV